MTWHVLSERKKPFVTSRIYQRKHCFQKTCAYETNVLWLWSSDKADIIRHIGEKKWKP